MKYLSRGDKEFQESQFLLGNKYLNYTHFLTDAGDEDIPLELYTKILEAGGNPNYTLHFKERVAKEDKWLAYDGYTVFMDVCSKGKLGYAKLLLEHGADINLVGIGFSSKSTAFSMACAKGHSEVIALLINAGALNNVEAVNYVLSEALKANRVDMVNYLLSNLKSSSDDNPL